MPSNLLPATITGSAQKTFSILINAPVSKVWDVLMDLSSYPSWNPSIRHLTLVDEHNRKPLPVEEQKLEAGKSILVGMQMTPSLDPSVKPQDTFELVIDVDHTNRRWAYRSHGTGPIFRAERAQAVMDIGEGVTQWEIRDVIGGVGGAVMGMVMGGKMTTMQEEMGKALKKFAEQN